MSDKPSVRINKVLRELNFSLDRVSEFLLKKKIKIDIRPTTKITNEVYQILLDELYAPLFREVLWYLGIQYEYHH